MQYIHRNIFGFYCTQNYALLIDIIKSKGIKINIPDRHGIGVSCYPERNICYIQSGVSLDSLEECEKEYIIQAKRHSSSIISPVSGTGEMFYEYKESMWDAKHGEPLIFTDNLIPIMRTIYYSDSREVGLLNVDKIKLGKHINITIPRTWCMYACIGKSGNIVRLTEMELSALAGFTVHVHYNSSI